MIRAVVFDLFHTLADPEETRPSDFVRIDQAARSAGMEPGDLQAWWDDQIPHILRWSTRPVDLLAEHLSRLGRDLSPEVLDEIDDVFGRFQDAALREPIAGAVEALDLLRERGLRLGLLSNAHERDVRAWDASPLAPRFDAAVISCFDGVAKPEAAAYEAILDRLGVEAPDAAFVGDGNGGELDGAAATGFGLVVAVCGPAVRSGLRTPDEMAELAAQADLAVEDVAGLPALAQLGG